ncbi:YggS family pyridoxal phosphate-dependent enzyme [Crassaminicella thermophila]|uniref:Pyridoxal phosphate homeostasis protein n=1 Tax=Crassaminicella thermophila TaxID=2599308 RepID=A0A5C0SFE4_CRATE|nr:YggS family pyridoxal phosphate-dependent enzyme [Crassaminicella thermophila]QEK11978.1 YggS family pyridoxal phosphate-dependent enzyme [Crassaminicella thermophila]
MTYIKRNILNIKKEIYETCNKIGRKPDDIQLIAVTKTVDSERINEAIMQGITDIGENRVQEIMKKYDDVSNVGWHLIGHLQTNKVKYIIDKVKMIHSLDRINLAEEINKRAKQHNRIMDVLVQVNVANEETKFGLDCSEVYEFLERMQPLEYIQVKGLMTIAPYEENPEDVRKYFKTLKAMFEEIKVKKLPRVEMKYLSMGMTNDFKVAIEEGSNMIRVGTGIFGSRNYNK